MHAERQGSETNCIDDSCTAGEVSYGPGATQLVSAVDCDRNFCVRNRCIPHVDHLVCNLGWRRWKHDERLDAFDRDGYRVILMQIPRWSLRDALLHRTHRTKACQNGKP